MSQAEGLPRIVNQIKTFNPGFSSLVSDAKGFIVDPETYLVNDVAGTLKQFLRSLPDPLLTHHLYAAFINAARKWQNYLP